MVPVLVLEDIPVVPIICIQYAYDETGNIADQIQPQIDKDEYVIDCQTDDRVRSSDDAEFYQLYQ